MEQRVLEILREEFEQIDFTSETLVDDGMMDSLTITEIIALFTMEFDIVIPYEEITEENFNSVHAMAKMVERLQE